MKRIHYFQHVPFENLGVIQFWAGMQGYNVTATQFHLGQSPPPMEALDWLIVMGGPMGVDDNAAYPWLAQEKKAIENALAAGKVVLGVCLGAQLIAQVLGAKVEPNAFKEIGWMTIYFTDACRNHPLAHGFPDKWHTFHWHGDTFTLPENACRLASSRACRNQGFFYQDRIIGLQFHLEVTRPGVEALVRHCATDLSLETPYVQSPSQILDANAPFDENIILMNRLLDNLDTLPV